jgi:hypothetical protein
MMDTAGFVVTLVSTEPHGVAYQQMVILMFIYTFQRYLDIKNVKWGYITAIISFCNPKIE